MRSADKGETRSEERSQEAGGGPYNDVYLLRCRGRFGADPRDGKMLTLLVCRADAGGKCSVRWR